VSTIRGEVQFRKTLKMARARINDITAIGQHLSDEHLRLVIGGDIMTCMCTTEGQTCRVVATGEGGGDWEAVADYAD
jgi:hypothetical protein